jgi:serine/threonine protein kinase
MVDVSAGTKSGGRRDLWPISDRRTAPMLDVMGAHPEKPFPKIVGGRYELLDRAGQGGMSMVWRAWDRVGERAVAVKVPDGTLAADPGMAGRLRREAEMTAAVSHPGVVRVHEYVEHDGPSGTVPSLVLEYLPDGDLRSRLATGRPEPMAALRTGAHIAAALAAIHSQGIVHCDVSASRR